MALTPSNMLPLGTEAPDFQLPDVVSGNQVALDELLEAHGLLVMFICNHCPYVKHVQEQLVLISNDYQGKGIGIVAISSNDVEMYPEDSPDAMREVAKKWQFHFPYLFDETQEVAKAYDAACTPDFYLFNGKKELVYRGQLDDSRPGNEKPVTGHDLRVALDDLIAGNPISENQIPSVGCNIKWKQ
ncbi:MAG: thioredoxin family protein [Bacteroidota bacterium]